jgi:hypothetical protein
MPINTEARDDSHCHQVFAVKQPGMDVCSIYTTIGGEAIKKMRREKKTRERVPVSIITTSFFSHCFKSNKK